MCRITLWETGECDVERILVTSGHSEVEHQIVNSPDDVEALMREVMTRLT